MLPAVFAEAVLPSPHQGPTRQPSTIPPPPPRTRSHHPPPPAPTHRAHARSAHDCPHPAPSFLCPHDAPEGSAYGPLGSWRKCPSSAPSTAAGAHSDRTCSIYQQQRQDRTFFSGAHATVHEPLSTAALLGPRCNPKLALCYERLIPNGEPRQRAPGWRRDAKPHRSVEPYTDELWI